MLGSRIKRPQGCNHRREGDVDETTFTAAINRLRRKVDVMRLESKARNEPRAGNYAEMLTLLDIIERAARKEMSDGNETR